MNKIQMQTVINRHESKIEDLKLREARIIECIKNCFPLPGCTDGCQIVSNDNYNKLVDEINNIGK